jgi:hypothetical protein
MIALPVIALQNMSLAQQHIFQSGNAAGNRQST